MKVPKDNAFLFTWLMLVASPISSQTIVKEKCYDVDSRPQQCYSLYHDVTRPTWDEASQKCQVDNKRLVTLAGDDAHDDINDFLGQELASGDGAWTSGRRSADNTWTYVMYGWTEMLSGTFPSEKYCSAIARKTLRRSSSACDHKLYGLCQYEPDSSGEHGTHTDCHSLKYDGNAICVALTPFAMTWFEARNHCRDKYEDGDLITLAATEDTMKGLEANMAAEELVVMRATNKFWIGLQRRPWQWVEPNEDASPIKSYYFSGDEGSDREQSCLYLRQSPDGAVSWADTACTSQGISHYICQTSTDTGSGRSIEPAQPGAGGTGATTLPSDTGSNTVYIASGITVAGVVSIVGVLLFLYVRRRRLEKAHRARSRSATQMTQSRDDPDGSSLDRPPISNPIPLDAPYPVSGIAKLGPLIPVNNKTLKDNPEGAYAEISDAPPSTGIATIYGQMFGGISPYATSVNFAESSPFGNEVASGGDNVGHVTTKNGDEYALPNKPASDLENVVVDNGMYHSNQSLNRL